MEKSSGHDENNSDELPNFELNIFDEPPSKVKRFANLSERELNDLVEKRYSDKTKKKYKLVRINLSRGVCVVVLL